MENEYPVHRQGVYDVTKKTGYDENEKAGGGRKFKIENVTFA